MRRRETLLGNTLSEVADLLFGADPYAQSLFALIADTQQEWKATASRVGRARLRSRLIAAFWQSVLLHARYRATRPPSTRAAASIALSVVLVGGTQAGVLIWLHGDWPFVIQQIFFLMPIFVSLPLSNPAETFVASVPERERWRTFHQFTLCWVALAILWTVVTGAPGWLPIGTVASAMVSRGIAAWLQRRRDRRAVRG